MKKITALLALLMLVGALAGCGKQNDTSKTDKLSIVSPPFSPNMTGCVRF